MTWQEAESERPGTVARDLAVSQVGARLDRLPVSAMHWRLVLLGQFVWASVLLLDVLVPRVYPVYWEPRHSFSPTAYALLEGAAVGLGPLLGEILFGYLADRIGRKRMMIVSCTVAGLAVWPLGITTNWWALAVCVVVSSLGIGGALTICPAYNSEWCPPAARGRLMLGAQVLSMAMLQFVGTLIALWLLPGHILAFVLVFAILPLATIPFIMATMPESARWLEEHGHADRADRLVSRLEAKAMAKHGELAPPDYAAHSVPDEEKAGIFEVFRPPYLSRTVVLLSVWVLFYFGPGGGFQPFQGVYIVSKGFTAHQLFLILLYAGFGAVGGVLIAALLNERVERRQLILAGALVFAVGVLLYLVGGNSFGMLVFASILASGGFGVMLTNQYNYTSAVFPTRLRSVGTGWVDGAGHISATFGALIAGIFYADTASANHVGWFAWFTFVGTLAPALLLFRFGRNQRRSPLEKVSR